MERVAVKLHLGERETGPLVTKVWRFHADKVCDATRASVQEELVQLFPDVSRRGLKFNLWYLDELAGEVSCISNCYCRRDRYIIGYLTYSYIILHIFPRAPCCEPERDPEYITKHAKLVL